MAKIRNRGEYQWEAQIRRKGYPAQRKTFETKSDAQAWARMIESEIDRGIFVSRVEAERTAFHQLIDRYISEIAPKHKGAYSEIKRLEALKRHPLATRIVATLTSSDFARYRDERLKIRKGNTVKRELALLQCVIEVARGEWGIHLLKDLPRSLCGRVFPTTADALKKAFVRCLERARLRYLGDCEVAQAIPQEDFLINLRFHGNRPGNTPS